MKANAGEVYTVYNQYLKRYTAYYILVYRPRRYCRIRDYCQFAKIIVINCKFTFAFLRLCVTMHLQDIGKDLISY